MSLCSNDRLKTQCNHPEAFGQHPNGDIASQIKERLLLFEILQNNKNISNNN